MFPFFELFGRTVGMYGLCAVLGLLVCGFVGFYLGKQHGLFLEDIVMVLLCTCGGILVGGHLLYGLLQIDSTISCIRSLDEPTFLSVLSCIATGFSGSVFYGGFFGSLAAVAIYGKVKRNRSLYLDMLAVCTPLFHTFGRVGCFLGGCCYGIESPFGFTAHNNPYVPNLNDVSRFPVQLVEAMLNFLLFVVLFPLYKKGKQTGKLIFVYMSIYAMIRFSLEFLRDDGIRGHFLIFSTSQWISLFLLPVAVISWSIVSRRKQQEH